MAVRYPDGETKYAARSAFRVYQGREVRLWRSPWQNCYCLVGIRFSKRMAEALGPEWEWAKGVGRGNPGGFFTHSEAEAERVGVALGLAILDGATT